MRYYKRLNPDGSTNTVESYSYNLDIEGAIEIDEKEFNKFIASLPEPEPPEPVRDYGKEIDGLKAEISNLKAMK